MSAESDNRGQAIAGVSVDSVLRAAKTIGWAMQAGVLIFLAVILGVLNKGWDGNAGILTAAGVVVGALMIVGHFVIPERIIRTQLQQALKAGLLKQNAAGTESALTSLWFAGWITKVAMLEGAAMLNGVVLLQEESVISLVLVAVLVILISLSLPSRMTLEWWIQDRLQQMSMQTE